MSTPTPNPTTAATPDEELAALVAQTQSLSKLALDMTKLCIDLNVTRPPAEIPTAAHSSSAKVQSLSKLAVDMTKLCIGINDAIPTVVGSQVAVAIAPFAPVAPQWIHAAALTPAQMQALHPPGPGDLQSCTEADLQVNGVPGQFRKKKDTREEALAFYEYKYNLNEVDKLVEVPAPAPAPTPVAAAAPAQSDDLFVYFVVLFHSCLLFPSASDI
ncbi:hypothetical protein DFH07DRAFT_767997 [Mycena maculata]|uniref:Uncharacterized protein n=1 Tax=Mycena maculata TaxID=230809 RepID=A0AAD7JXQ9_9AGAR|nr:hypothetical protein DFH07DRAFT_767997 [Mycena maculata]